MIHWSWWPGPPLRAILKWFCQQQPRQRSIHVTTAWRNADRRLCLWEHWLTHQYIFHTLPEGISFAGRSSRYDNSRISSQCHSFALPMVLLGVWRKRNLYKRMLFVWNFHSIWRPCHLIRHYRVQNLYVINAKWVRLLLFVQVHSCQWVCHEADAILRGAQGVVVHQLREGTFLHTWYTSWMEFTFAVSNFHPIFIRAPQITLLGAIILQFDLVFRTFKRR